MRVRQFSNQLRCGLLLLLISWIYCGHEVLYQFPESQLALQNQEIAIVQYDSRRLGNYWNISARWNRDYAEKYGHGYYFLSKKHDTCVHGETQLAPPWCKVLAMIAADKMIPSDKKMIIFMDSDALITVNYSMSAVISYIKKDLHWDWKEKPLVFNQDGPGFACKHAIFVDYGICLNSGVVIWMRNPISTKILESWWDSSTGLQNSTRFRMNWKLKVNRGFVFLQFYHLFYSLSIVALGTSSTIRDLPQVQGEYHDLLFPQTEIPSLDFQEESSFPVSDRFR
jgi:hypothetical protein